jgi:prepilin signal peptidase PulO-like enzyme (type II secretory pathway)
LQFILISLISRRSLRSGGAEAGSTFSTPTVVHFTVALLLAAVGTAPWHRAAPVAILWSIFGIAGVVYEIDVIRRLLRQNAYRPEAEDWLFHAALPLLAYGVLAAAAIYERSDFHRALFAAAAAVLLLVVIGIHNAWDAAAYHVFSVKSGQSE